MSVPVRFASVRVYFSATFIITLCQSAINSSVCKWDFNSLLLFVATSAHCERNIRGTTVPFTILAHFADIRGISNLHSFTRSSHFSSSFK